jgi:tetraprenyl-beta-curcumene synthase
MAVAAALGTYRRGIVPAVQRQLASWETSAETIPNRVLRDHALDALRRKGANAEATAVLAILAPRPRRAAALRAITSLQVAVDYLDSLGEQTSADPLANGLQLHRALIDALAPGEPVADWYRLNPQQDDGGYLRALVSACREAVESMPAATVALPAARRAAERCRQGQSHTHAAELGDGSALEKWASRLEAPPGYSWWELAAGASSSVGAHALIAAAADPETTAAETELVDAAYFPPVGALTVLLDDLVDRDEDLAAGAHNYMLYYPSAESAAERLALIAGYSMATTAALRHRPQHAAILAGVAAYYLSTPAAASGFGRPARDRMLTVLGPTVWPIYATMRLRQRKRPGGAGK